MLNNIVIIQSMHFKMNTIADLKLLTLQSITADDARNLNTGTSNGLSIVNNM